MSLPDGIFRNGKFYKNPALAYAEEQTKLPEELNSDGSKIVEFFKGKSVLLTGATGFFGKMIMEKLLRACRDIDSIFVICREKKGKDMHTRLDELFNDPLYKKLTILNPKFRHKVTAIKGDISLPGLGLTIEDRLLLISKVNVILHCAATVRFDESLHKAFDINVRGAREMLMLGKECTNLQSYIHVSTAYSHCNRYEIDEKFYPTHISVDELEEILKSHSDQEIEDKTNSILGTWPNTYTFTKALVENWVNEHSEGVPVCVFRPSIVLSTYNEPIRGWTDNIYGPAGVALGAGVGMLRTLHCDGKSLADIVPVDLVVNALLAAAYQTSRDEEKKAVVYNYVSSVQQPITWDEFMFSNSTYGIQIPSEKTCWYYNFRLTKYYIVDLFLQLILHFIPALLLDGVCILIGKKPQLTKAHKKIFKFSKVISYFSCGTWLFKNNNVQNLWCKMSSVDQTIFPFDMSDVSWDYHSEMNMMGLRTYVVKDDPSSIPKMMPKWKALQFIDSALQYIVIFIALRILYGVITALLF